MFSGNVRKIMSLEIIFSTCIRFFLPIPFNVRTVAAVLFTYIWLKKTNFIRFFLDVLNKIIKITQKVAHPYVCVY